MPFDSGQAVVVGYDPAGGPQKVIDKMAEQTEFEREMAQLLVSALELEDVDAAEIRPMAPLFGHEPDSLGLDSIDALEIALAVKQQFGVELRADDEQNSRIFASLRALTNYVQATERTSADPPDSDSDAGQ